MIPAGEEPAYFYERGFGKFPYEKHGDLAGNEDVSSSLLAPELGRGNRENLCHGGRDDSRGQFLAEGSQCVRQDSLCESEIDGGSVDPAGCREPVNSTFELPYIVSYDGCYEIKNLRGEELPFIPDLQFENGHAGLVVRRLDIGDQAGLESRYKPFLERSYLAREPVRGQDDLPPALIELVETMEELLLGLLLPGQKLNIIHQQDVHLPVYSSEFIDGLSSQRCDEEMRELFGRDIDEALPGMQPLDLMGYALYEMGFSEPYASIYEKRIVRGIPRIHRHRLSAGVSQFVARTRDEPVECIAGMDVVGPDRLLGLGDMRRSRLCGGWSWISNAHETDFRHAAKIPERSLKLVSIVGHRPAGHELIGKPDHEPAVIHRLEKGFGEPCLEG